MKRNKMLKIKDIISEKFYNTTSFDSITYDNNDPVKYDITFGKKIGKIPYIKNKTAHIMKGSDVSAFLMGKMELIRTEEQVAKDKFKGLSDNDLFDVLKKNNRLEKEKSVYKKKYNEYKKENDRLKEEIETIKKLYAKRDIVEMERKSKVLNYIKEILFNNEKVKQIGYELCFTCGIYFLIKDNQVVYVGQSVNIAARIVVHRNDGKDFDEVRFIRCEKDVLDEREMFFIKLLKPDLNGDYKNSGHEDIFKIIMSIN